MAALWALILVCQMALSMSWKQNGQSTIMGWIVLMAGSYAETYFLGEPSITLKSINFSYNGAATRTSSRLTFQSSRTRRFIYVSHPVSGITHTLTVQEIEQQTVPQIVWFWSLDLSDTLYCHELYTYPWTDGEHFGFDCDEGDRPIEVTPDDHSFRPVGSSSCFVVGVIGGADGPTAVIYGTNSQEKLHAACSALHFEPVGDDVEWRIVFNVTQFDKETFPII